MTARASVLSRIADLETAQPVAFVASNSATSIRKLAADYVCDGFNDETEINAAITSLGTRDGKVRLTGGFFSPAAPINVNRDNVILEGDGPGTPATGGTGTDPVQGGTLITPTAGFVGNYVINCALDTPNRALFGIFLRDFAVQGFSSPTVGGINWQVTWGGCSNLFIEYMHGTVLYSTAYDEPPPGGIILGTAAPYDCFFHHLRLRANYGDVIVFDNQSTDHLISNCIISQNGGTGIKTQGGAAGNSASLQVSNSYIYSNGGKGIDANSWQCKIYDTRVQDNHQGGIYISGGAGDGAGFQIVGGNCRNNSIAVDNTYDDININMSGAVYGGLISGVDFCADDGLDNTAHTKVRYGINVVNGNMNDLVIGPCSVSRKGGSYSATFGTAFINNQGERTQIAPLTLARKAVAASTQSLSEVSLASVSVPGGLMSANGQLRVTAVWSRNAGGTSTVSRRIRFSGGAGTIYQDGTLSTANLSDKIQASIANRGATNSQVGHSTGGSGGWGQSSSAPVTGSADTKADTTVELRGSVANAADTVTLESYLVELLPG